MNWNDNPERGKGVEGMEIGRERELRTAPRQQYVDISLPEHKRGTHVVYLGFCGFTHRHGFEVLFEVLREENGIRLPLEHKKHHSEDGFAWGYSGSGPADLARSILWDALGLEPPPWLYQVFKDEVVARWPGVAGSSWTLPRESVLKWAAGMLVVRGAVILARAQGEDLETLGDVGSFINRAVAQLLREAEQVEAASKAAAEGEREGAPQHERASVG